MLDFLNSVTKRKDKEAALARFFALARRLLGTETKCARYLGLDRCENLCRAISWFTFLLQLRRQ